MMAHQSTFATARGTPRWWMRYLVTPGLVLLSGCLLIFFLGLAQRFGWIVSGDGRVVSSGGEDSEVYTCAMHPQIRQPQPGRCPICSMPLVPASSSKDSNEDELAVRIEPARRRLANIETVSAERTRLTGTIRSVGLLAVDESRQVTISAYISGRIEKLFADYTGVEVARGDHLAVIYSPELFARQVEYVESRKAANQAGDGMLEVVRRTQEKLATNARHRLVELGMTEEQLAELDRTETAISRLTLHAPAGGTVIEKPVVEGKYVAAGEPIYRIADLSTVWLMLQLFPEDASRVRFGQQVFARVRSLPGRIFEGRVAFISPTVATSTRTVDVRIELENPGRVLRPGDYAEAAIDVPLYPGGDVYDADLADKWISPMHPQIIRDEPGDCPICGMSLVPTSSLGYTSDPDRPPMALVVPRSAVLMTGGTSLVYVETEPGRFEIRPVEIGSIQRDLVAIVAGLEEGEQVAVSGNFLIDSQMQLSGRPSLIDPTRAIARAQAKPKPLDLGEFPLESVPGEEGRFIEEFLDAYLVIQIALSEDRVPRDDEVEALLEAAQRIDGAERLPRNIRDEIARAAEESAHLHHLKIERARELFKPLSRAVLRLASRYRGESAEPVMHYFCEMVPGGNGDWLQRSLPPANPYWGEKMLRCVQHQRELPVPPSGTTETEEDR
jgi:membrane fusion protein, copper/silver efflux system